MPKKEKVTTAGINRLLDSHAPFVAYYRPVPGLYGGRILDYIGTSYGHSFVIEAKRLGLQPTDHQIDVMKDWWFAGAAVFAIDGSEETMQPLREWLDLCKRTPMPNIRPVWIPRHIPILETPK